VTHGRRGFRFHPPWLGGCAFVCVLSASLSAQEPVFPEPLTLEAAFARAFTANPTIVAARFRRNIDVAGVDLGRQRPNPAFHAELTNELPKQIYGLAIPVEIGGKRSRRIAVSEAAVETGEAELARTVVEVRAEVRRAYFNRVVAEARLTLVGDLQGIATRARDAAQQRFDAGSAPRLEVLQAQLALAQAENDATAALAAAGAARVQLNALLGLPLDAPGTLSTPLDAPTIALQPAIASAEASSVELAVLDRRIEEQRLEVSLARAMQVPDVILDAAITRDAEPEFSTGWRAAFAIALPLFTLNGAAVRVEEATLTHLKAQRDATATRIRGEVESTAALVEAQRQQYLRYRDQILPQALEVERMAEDSYRLGQTGIVALLSALQASRDARLRSLQVAADFQNGLADLERVTGAPIP